LSSTKKLSLIEDRGQTDRVDPWPWPVTFSFNPSEPW